MPAEFGPDYSYLVHCQSEWNKPSYRAWWFARAYLEVSREVGLPKGSSILSVGSGMGQLEHFLDGRFGYEVYRLDINLHALQTGQALFKQNSAVVADTVCLPFPNNSFDFILSYDLLEHLPNEHSVHTAFSEMERVVTDSGGVRMLHKITVREEKEAIDADDTHHIKRFANEWQSWFEERGWHTQKPISHKIPIWSRRKVGLCDVEGAYYLARD